LGTEHRAAWVLLSLALLLARSASVFVDHQEKALSWVIVEPDSSSGGFLAAEPPSWLWQETKSNLMLAADFRGDYGSFFLIVADSTGDQLPSLRRRFNRFSFRPVAPSLPHDQLWVVECTADLALESLPGQVDMLVYATVPRKNVKQLGQQSHVLKAEQAPRASQAKITVIPVPKQAMVPVGPLEQSSLAPVLKGLNMEEPNAKIVDLLRSISRQNIVNYLADLTAINSRLSTSTTVIEATNLLEAHYSKSGLEVTKHAFRSGYAENVIAELKGREDPSKVVVIGAHYDCRAANIQDPVVRAPGADDNGSGSVALMELARAFATSNLHFKYTIRFCSWAGEEQGLYGSRAYAQLMKDNRVDIVAALNADMIGWKNPRTGLVIGLVTRFTTEWLTEAAQNVSALYLPDLPVGFSSTACCSDQQSFLEQGYPATSYFESTGGYVDYPEYHKSTDLPQYVDYEQIELITKSATALVATLAVPI